MKKKSLLTATLLATLTLVACTSPEKDSSAKGEVSSTTSSSLPASASSSVKASFTITLPQGDGYTATPGAGYGTSVEAGKDYAFSVTLSKEKQGWYEVVVKVDGAALALGDDGLYHIQNIQKVPEISIVLQAITFHATFQTADGENHEETYTYENRDAKLAILQAFRSQDTDEWDYRDDLPESLPHEDHKTYTETKAKKEYEITFENEDGTVLQTGKVAYGDTPTYNGEVPTKAVANGYRYTFKGWDKEIVSVTGATTYKATYTQEAITYHVTFMADGKQVGDPIAYTVDNKDITAPAVPEKTGYTGVWEAYDLTTGDVTVNAVYTLITYHVTFKAGDTIVAIVDYDVEHKDISVPEVPAKAGYTGAWEAYSLTTGDVTVNAVYSVITYHVTFMADGKQVGDPVAYTVENKNITAPVVPTKTGYTGAWEEYTLSTGDVTVNAVYTAIQYAAIIHYADGSSDETLNYTIENRSEILAQIQTKLHADTDEWDYSNDLPSELPLENTTITETRTKKNYAVRFEQEDGTEISTNTLEYGSSVMAPEAPTKAGNRMVGYAFAGWKNGEADPVTTIPAVTGTATYRASYTADATVIYGGKDTETIVNTGDYPWNGTVSKTADSVYGRCFAMNIQNKDNCAEANLAEFMLSHGLNAESALANAGYAAIRFAIYNPTSTAYTYNFYPSNWSNLITVTLTADSWTEIVVPVEKFNGSACFGYIAAGDQSFISDGWKMTYMYGITAAELDQKINALPDASVLTDEATLLQNYAIINATKAIYDAFSSTEKAKVTASEKLTALTAAISKIEVAFPGAYVHGGSYDWTGIVEEVPSSDYGKAHSYNFTVANSTDGLSLMTGQSLTVDAVSFFYVYNPLEKSVGLTFYGNAGSWSNETETSLAAKSWTKVTLPSTTFTGTGSFIALWGVGVSSGWMFTPIYKTVA